MARLVMDLESNGLLDKLDRIHCLVVADAETGELDSYHGPSLQDGLQRLAAANEIIGHNIIDFDIPAIQKVFPQWEPSGRVFDTLVVSRLIWSDLKQRDYAMLQRRSDWIPGNLVGSHGLEAWGHRLGFHKGDYKHEMKSQGLDPWATFNERMLEYCENDVALNHHLLEKIEKKDYSERAIELEHRVFEFCREQRIYGCSFDLQKAEELHMELTQERIRLEKKLKEAFPPWYVSEGKFVPKRSNKKMGYVEGCELTKVKLTELNPSSRDQLANRLMTLRGWKPKVFTDGGKPKVDESVLSKLKWPEAKLAARYMLVQKRLGQIAEGKAAWLKLEKDGRIHGRLNTNGAVTGRCTHQSPNLAQVPAVRSPWGLECRSLFRATPGWAFVGGDASGLELRCLAHYMARWDGGAYVDALLNADIHTHNQNAAGLETRDLAKTFCYGLIYGAGDQKIGEIIGKGRKAGKELRERFMKGLPALKNLIDAVKGKAAKTRSVRGLDGRIIPVESEHAALNRLLQGAGAIVMKQSLVNLHDICADAGLVRGDDYRQVLFVHDEVQVECKPEHKDTVGQAIVDGIRKAGEDFEFRCPLDGEYKTGLTWADTH